jgi:hypothetical protein
MYGNPCLRAARKSTDAVIGAIWSNAERRHGFYVVEEYGRPVGTRTPDLYRVNAAHRFYNNIQDRGDCQSTRKFI